MEKENNIELSIVVPVYNVEEYLEECLSSVYKIKNIKYEVILVDSDSKDRSLEIIKKFKEENPKNTIVISKKSEGVSIARNVGIETARGKYIYFLDSDDFFNPEKFREFFLEAKKRDVDMLLGNGEYYYTDKSRKKLYDGNAIEKIGIIDGQKFITEAVEKNALRYEVWLYIFKREFLIKNSLKFEKDIYHEDILFSIKGILLSENISAYNINFYSYRQRAGSIMSTENPKKNEDLIYVFNAVIEFLKEKNIKNRELNSELFKYFYHFSIQRNIFNYNCFKNFISLKFFRLSGYKRILKYYFLAKKDNKNGK